MMENVKLMTHPPERMVPRIDEELGETDSNLVALIRAVRRDETERNSCGVRGGGPRRCMDIWHALVRLGVDPWDAHAIINRSFR